MIRQFLHFKVSKKQIRSTAAYFTCQKRLLNEEQPMLETIKKNLNAEMNYIDYMHDCLIFLVSNRKNSKVRKVKNMQNLLCCVICYLST